MLNEMDLQITSDAFNRTDPQALINRVGPSVQAAMCDAQKREPDLFGLDERELFQVLRASGRLPTPTDNQLRLKFWLEYEHAQSEARPMSMGNVYAGICSAQFFNTKYLHSPTRVAWMLTIPSNYDVMMEEGVSYGISLLRSYLDIDAMPGGKPNLKLMELQTKIVLMLDMRLKGGHTQRTETKSLNLNVSTTDRKVAQATQELSMEALEKRIKELDRRDKKSQNQINASGVVDVESS